MNLLLHICCGPCSIFPLTRLKKLGVSVNGFFYNPNIHPFKEFKRRIESTRFVAETFSLSLEIDARYGLVDYLRHVVFHENNRCPLCYDMRLKYVARLAFQGGYDSFSSTLLYSKYQDHQTIREIGLYWARHYGIDFFYEDFREGWQYGIDQSLSLEIYRQPYCGCIYSEQERYDNHLKKKLRKRKRNKKE